MSLPASQRQLLKELAERSRQGPADRTDFIVAGGFSSSEVIFEGGAEAPNLTEVTFDSGAPKLTEVFMPDFEQLVEAGFVHARRTSAGELRASVTHAGFDYVAKNLRPLAGG